MMLAPTDNNGTPGVDSSPPNKLEYHYDLRLEIGVKREDETIPVVTIFHDLVQRMKNVADPGAVIVILTATDKLFFEQKDMSSEEFQKAFQVDETRGKMSKVLLGFKLRTTMRLSDLKKRLMNTFLIPNNMFLREHTGGFHHGVTSYTFGFLKDEHPDHPDIIESGKRILRIVKEAWKEIDKDDKNKWRNEFPSIFLGNNAPIFPIRFTKERVTAAMDAKEKIVTHALMVSTPTKYGKLLRAVLSLAVIKKKITNLIPFALSREEPSGYYSLVASQARFMENHRNIQISNVPDDSNKHLGAHGKTLYQVLTGNNKIQRVAYDPKDHKYHVSTRANAYRETHQWIKETLEEHKFIYRPEVKTMKFDYGNSGPKSSVYSDVFKDAISVAAETQDSSTIKTTRSNAWQQRPPLAISYVKVPDAFPPLTTTKQHALATQSTASETLDEDTIQSAISAAIKKLEAQHQAEINKLRQELRTELDLMKNQMKEMAHAVATQTYQALATEDSPLATKAEFARLDHRQSIQENQLATIIELLKGGHSKEDDITSRSIDTTSPPRNLKRTKPTLTPVKKNLCTDVFSTQSTDDEHQSSELNMTSQSLDDDTVPSATSDPFEDMEGCED